VCGFCVRSISASRDVTRCFNECLQRDRHINSLDRCALIFESSTDESTIRFGWGKQWRLVACRYGKFALFQLWENVINFQGREATIKHLAVFFSKSVFWADNLFKFIREKYIGNFKHNLNGKYNYWIYRVGKLWQFRQVNFMWP